MEEPELIVKAGILAETVINKLKELSKNLVLAESCTAGLVSSFLTQISGASRVFFGSYISYTKDAKITMFGLDRRLLDKYALVSGEIASSMASGALEKSGADLAVAVTGLAGPSGDGSEVKIGTVWIAAASKKAGILETRMFQFDGPRNYIRLCAAVEVLEAVKFQLENDLTKN
jgi:PncC family amidohydrolase